MNALAPFFLFLALLGVFAIVLVPIGFAVWVHGLRSTPTPELYTAAELRALVRREFRRSPVPDDSEQRLAEFISGGQS